MLPKNVQFVPFHDSVVAVLGGSSPPNANAAVFVPAPAILDLPVFKSLTSVQFEPFHNSVFAGLPGFTSPPNATAAVLSAPVIPKLYLAVFKSLTSVQLVPFHDSVKSFLVESGFAPPASKAEV